MSRKTDARLNRRTVQHLRCRAELYDQLSAGRLCLDLALEVHNLPVAAEYAALVRDLTAYLDALL